MTATLVGSDRNGMIAGRYYGVKQVQMQSIIMSYFASDDAFMRLREAGLEYHELENMMRALLDFQDGIKVRMVNYCGTTISRWALKVVPAFAAAGLQAGIEPKGEIASPNTLITFCGMEPRRYITANQAKEVMETVGGSNSRSQIFTAVQIEDIAKRLELTYQYLGEQATWDDVYLWATKRRHNEFLRTVCLRLGDWLSQNESKYRPVYDQLLRNESDRNLDVDSRLVLNQIQHRARIGAVRVFLNDYYTHWKGKDDVPQIQSEDRTGHNRYSG